MTSPLTSDMLNRLVELHILTEHGDPVASADAASWIARDDEARRIWDTVESHCQLLRSDPAAE